MFVEQLAVVLFLAIMLYLVSVLNFSKKLKTLMFLVIFLESVVLISTFAKFDIYLSLLLMFISLAIFFLKINPEGLKSFLVKQPLDQSETLLFNFKDSNLLTFVGGIFFVVIILSEFFLFDGIYNSNTFICLIFAVLCLFYSYVPNRFNLEINFSLVFIFSIMLFVVFPNIYIDINQQSIFSNLFFISTPELVNLALARPLASFLSLLGYNVYAVDDKILYEDLESNTLNTVLIGEGCSGIYSFLIGLSAIFSYLIVNNKNSSKTILISTFPLVLVGYIANIFRMSTIVLAGHYWGYDALEWVHANVGSLLFIIWFFFYWTILERYMESYVY